MKPFLTVIVPTQGRTTLARTLASVREQAGPDDVEILVIADTHGPLVGDIEGPARKYGARYLEHDAGHHCWGHCQINVGLEIAAREWLAGSGAAYVSFNDDDDIYTPGAMDAIAAAIRCRSGIGPVLFQFRTHWGSVLWDAPRAVETEIGGHCIVAPAERCGRWTCRYAGDYDFIAGTLSLYSPAEAMWVPRVIAAQRP
jgi:hypothetical protein